MTDSFIIIGHRTTRLQLHQSSSILDQISKLKQEQHQRLGRSDLLNPPVEQRRGLGPEEKDGDEEEQGVGQHREEGVARALEDEPRRRGARRSRRPRVPPPPQQHVGDWAGKHGSEQSEVDGVPRGIRWHCGKRGERTRVPAPPPRRAWRDRPCVAMGIAGG
jgi:hypothetical protein